MVDKENVVGVALTKCYYCGGDCSIVMNTKLNPYAAKQVEKMHQLVINMDPCAACNNLMKDRILLIGIEENQSNVEWFKEYPPNPYRVGKIVWAKDHMVEWWFQDEPKFVGQSKKVRFAFVPGGIVEHIIKQATEQGFGMTVEEHEKEQSAAGKEAHDDTK